MSENKNTGKNSNPLDQLFRKDLNTLQYRPSKRVWKGIENNYLKIALGRSKHKMILGFIAVIALLAIGVLFVLYPFNSNYDKAENNLPLQPGPILTQPMPATENQNIAEENKENTSDMKQLVPISQEKNTKLVAVVQEPTPHKTKAVEVDNKFFPEALVTEVRYNPISNYQAFKMEFLNIGRLPIPHRLSNMNPRAMDIKSMIHRSNYAKTKNVSLGIHLTPGITYYRSRPNKLLGAFDVNISWKPSAISLETGLGLSHELDNSDFVVNYESYDSIGFYYNINSFSYDPVNDTVIFNKSAVGVYDSVEHLTLTHTVTQYTYLQIPLGLKYRFIHFNRVSFSARAGGILSLLLYKNEPEANPGLGDVRIHQIEQRVPTRLKTSWKLYAGIQFSYQLSNKISFDIEPIYMQYLKSPYEGRENKTFKRPYAVGIRTGISIHF